MKTRVSKAMIILIIMLSLFSVSGCSKAQQDVQPATIKVDTAVVKKMDITKYAGYVGSVKASNEQVIMASLPKRVTAVYVTAGQKVEKGQILVLLDSSKIAEAVQQAEAGLATAEAALEANKVQRQMALNNYNRYQELHKIGAVSDMELENAKAQYDSLNTGTAEAGVAQAEAAVSLARQNLADCEIISPISGVVGLVNASVGKTASVTSPIVVINNSKNLEIEVGVSESDVSSIKAGTPAKVKIGALDEKELTGTVESVASVADSLTHTYPVKITLPNTSTAEVKSGMFAEVKLSTQRGTGVLAIPMTAVLPKNGENIVYVVNDQNKAETVAVETGLSDGTYTEIRKGLQEGQTVIIKGNTLIDETSALDLADGGTVK
ncbi:MAG TPA: efflux RND transporter periplasmic adaptor subunit [Desulfitobacteriaceae bacterium]|nr:efflux RND transporter periplasmic adaptor subunit [Desulfitobacteriaceae bacterium]